MLILQLDFVLNFAMELNLLILPQKLVSAQLAAQVDLFLTPITNCVSQGATIKPLPIQVLAIQVVQYQVYMLTLKPNHV